MTLINEEHPMKKLKNYKIGGQSVVHTHITSVIWYLIFLILIPLVIVNLWSPSNLMYYLPMVDLIANVCTSPSSKLKYLFRDLYELSPDNSISFISTNFINLIALIGVSWNGVHHAFTTNKMWIGIKVTVIMYIITYLLPTQGIGWVIKKFHRWFSNKIKQYPNTEYTIKKHLDYSHAEIIDYMGGFIFIILLVITEFIIIKLYLKSVELIS